MTVVPGGMPAKLAMRPARARTAAPRSCGAFLLPAPASEAECSRQTTGGHRPCWRASTFAGSSRSATPSRWRMTCTPVASPRSSAPRASARVAPPPHLHLRPRRRGRHLPAVRAEVQAASAHPHSGRAGNRPPSRGGIDAVVAAPARGAASVNRTWLAALVTGLVQRLPLDFSGELHLMFKRPGFIAVHQLASLPDEAAADVAVGGKDR